MSKIITFGLAIVGATAGWVLSLSLWLEREGRGSGNPIFWFAILLFTVLLPGLTLCREPRKWRHLAIFTGIAMFMSLFLGPSADMSPSRRVEELLTSPFTVFGPSCHAVAAVLGATVGLWLDEIRAFIRWASELVGLEKPRSKCEDNDGSADPGR